ncbi:DUF1097 domain-containing protein [Rhodoferax sp.]|uniref:DUF1097 domain-containing protein n=1 Tax=Rhodoferax sp. TaxID=50421 RepID=UPI00374D4721
MQSKEAYTVSIGLLAVADTYLTATALPVPVWVTFIAWASFFVVGGGSKGLVQSIVSNLSGMAISALTLLAIGFSSGSPLAAAVCVGIGSAAMVQASKATLLAILPAVVWGFASTVGTTVATGKPITTLGLDNPALVAATALVVGGLFGYISELLGEALTEKRLGLA